MHIDKRWIGLAAGAALFFALIAAGISLVLITKPSTTSLVGNPLVTDDRDRLAVCVEGIGVPLEVTQRSSEAARSALTTVLEHNVWDGADPPNPALALDVGCPGQPAAFSTERRGDIVTHAGEYRLMYFVVSDVDMIGLFSLPGNSPFSAPFHAVLPEEIICTPEACTEVTSGVYVAAPLAASEEYLESVFLEALKIESP